MFKSYQRTIHQVINIDAIQFDGRFTTMGEIIPRFKPTEVQFDLSGDTIKTIRFTTDHHGFVIEYGDYVVIDEHDNGQIMHPDDFEYQYGTPAQKQRAGQVKLLERLVNVIRQNYHGFTVTYNDGLHGVDVDFNYESVDDEWFARSLLTINRPTDMNAWHQDEDVEKYIHDTIIKHLDTTHQAHIEGSKGAAQAVPTWLWKQ